ncbi:MAG TPA: M20 family peptidase, partial [Anaerolineae bacterium]|nr:M20 family peptidase [Anaerolineae bacterium]
MPDLLNACRLRLPQALALLKRIVALESPSTDKAAVDRCSAFVENAFRELGLTTRRSPCAGVGDQVFADWPGQSQARILGLMHLDTVWPIGTLERMPLREENGRLYGPGAYDSVRLLFTGDEEIGSDASLDLIRAEARQA